MLAALLPTVYGQMVVLHAAHLLDIESGRLLSPGEVLVEGERIAQAAGCLSFLDVSTLSTRRQRDVCYSTDPRVIAFFA